MGQNASSEWCSGKWQLKIQAWSPSYHVSNYYLPSQINKYMYIYMCIYILNIKMFLFVCLFFPPEDKVWLKMKWYLSFHSRNVFYVSRNIFFRCLVCIQTFKSSFQKYAVVAWITHKTQSYQKYRRSNKKCKQSIFSSVLSIDPVRFKPGWQSNQLVQ